MKLSPRERAMLREMGVAWPEGLEGEVKAAPVPSSAVSTSAVAAPDAPTVVAPTVTPPTVTVPDASVPTATVVGAGSWADGLSWEELQSAVSSCNRCGLCAQRRKSVFGVGHPRAAWMVVGEAPGEHEDRQGEPFVGAAGQLLDRMLASIDLSREAAPIDDAPDGRAVAAGASERAADRQVFITNTVKCRPPQNRNPEPAELAACAPVLQRQMELVRPRLVLAMGRFAAQQLLRTEEPLGRLRGRVHRLTGAGAAWAGDLGVPVVVTYHPAYLLRNPIDKAKAWDDLCLALDTMAALPVGD